MDKDGLHDWGSWTENGGGFKRVAAGGGWVAVGLMRHSSKGQIGY